MLDILITGGRIVDGGGNPWFYGDVGIQGDRIVAVGKLNGERARRIIKADGLTVCPGFTDMHTHSDIQLLANPRQECKVMQGVTSEVIGQDGLSFAPVNAEVRALLREQIAGWNGDPPGLDWDWEMVTEYLDRFDGKVATNVAFLVPHGTVRMLVTGMANRAPNEQELTRMQELVAEAMEQGAVGLSTGLTYAPAMFATDEEMVELCKAIRPYQGFYCPHHRSYGAKAMEQYANCIEIGRKAGVAVHFTHAQLSFPSNRGRGPELLALVDTARRQGVEVTLDSYAYNSGASYLHALLPGWAQEGGTEAILRRLQDPQERERIRVAIEESGSDGFSGEVVDWEGIQIAGVSTERNRRFTGLRLSEAAAQIGVKPFELFCNLLIEERLGVSMLVFIGNEDNIRTIMTHPAHMAGSDGILIGDRPHPRGWGTFARYLAVCVRELGILTLENAIRKMTSLPAQRLGFFDRGLVRPGMAADIVIFDPDRVQDTATYEEPRRYPEGVPFVLVNGTVVKENGQHTGALAGRALRSPFGRVPRRVSRSPK